ncbi:RsbRD N-terminal domain-containing protein [Desulfosporosinus hippei]|uniref:RsbT co-antagonist protein rsbRD N-terminal domain-containing protein n=1 Tax=Desulfosporosinus hippei DSM 8344 TaxID=1121419 RepID=A0A1G7TA84_9FIRM|nr:RsbRD N-terminal domain-containing protein [Desulfosporosinus hippei]SDG31924.1 RsbT co-antagonist protein rsbRD N-terminal domain-containing protein [Desulfosporosinus hippei DSM 8344]
MDMMIKDLIEEKKPAILQQWFDAIMATYPTDTSGFLKDQKDRFRNPVGHTFTEGMDKILEALIAGEGLEEELPFIDDIIRVRAIQDFTPAKALSFVFSLKGVVRKELEQDIKKHQIYGELMKFETEIDRLALNAFNIYVRCREQLYELRTDELKRMTFTLLKKANLMSELPMEEFGDSPPINPNNVSDKTKE